MSIYNEKPWLKYYDPGMPPSLAPYKPVAMHQLLEETAQKYPNNIATITSAHLPVLGRVSAELTWKEIDEAASKLAAGLAAMGMKKGDVVAIIMPNCVQFIIAFFGILKAGGIVSATNPTYPPDKMAYQIDNSQAKFVIAVTLFYEMFKSIQSKTKVEKVIVSRFKEYLPPAARTLFTLAREKKSGHFLADVQPGDVWFQDILAQYKASDQPKLSFNPAEDIAIFQYTGGTTGVSKGAMSTHTALVANCTAIQRWLSSGDVSKERLVGAIPFFHVYGMVAVVLFGASSGASIAIVPNARDITDLLQVIDKFKPTIFSGVPALYNAINNHPLVKEKKVSLSSLRYCTSGSAPLPPDVKFKFEEMTGVNILEGFGMSECPTVTHFNPLGRPGKLQSIGVPLPDVECRLVSLDDSVTDVPQGEPGELIIRGPNIMKGYLGMPTETTNALRDLGDGGAPWLYTGDIAYMDEEGYFFIVDRKKDMALIGGFNVYPTVIEKTLAEHPAVMEVGVAAIPHPEKEGQEALLACIVVRPGHEANDALKKDLIEFQSKKLAQYEVARRIVFVPELPKTAVGKTLRRELAKLAAEVEVVRT